MNIEVHRTPHPKARPASDKLGFGRFFTDHLFRAEYTPESGWSQARVDPFAAFSLDPAAAVLHYGQAIFEGLKAFRGEDGKVRFFRLRDHAERFARSAELLCMPKVDTALFMDGVRKVVEVDADWIPTSAGASLYLRPTMIATEAFLGVRPSQSYLFYVILSPVGAYYAEGFNPLRIWIEREKVRAAPGGLGAAKTGGNYAASLYAAERAKKNGYAQVLWVDAREHRFLEEVGTMNLLLQIGDTVVTPPLGGSILQGVTRDSVLTLLKDMGVPVQERPISIDEIMAAHQTGALREVFGTGTAAVISPVGELAFDDKHLKIGDGLAGPLSRRLHETLANIHYGKIPDTHEWISFL